MCEVMNTRTALGSCSQLTPKRGCDRMPVPFTVSAHGVRQCGCPVTSLSSEEENVATFHCHSLCDPGQDRTKFLRATVATCSGLI